MVRGPVDLDGDFGVGLGEVDGDALLGDVLEVVGPSHARECGGNHAMESGVGRGHVHVGGSQLLLVLRLEGAELGVGDPGVEEELVNLTEVDFLEGADDLDDSVDDDGELLRGNARGAGEGPGGVGETLGLELLEAGHGLGRDRLEELGRLDARAREGPGRVGEVLRVELVESRGSCGSDGVEELARPDARGCEGPHRVRKALRAELAETRESRDSDGVEELGRLDARRRESPRHVGQALRVVVAHPSQTERSEVAHSAVIHDALFTFRAEFSDAMGCRRKVSGVEVTAVSLEEPKIALDGCVSAGDLLPPGDLLPHRRLLGRRALARAVAVSRA
mmetsp:Transcript_22940/g.71963  ORF Transcript_22940/g.71963 Transcript_22940/m.71963 type:complete len:335 (-) Transcript_22940:246-1250(-)